MSASFGRWGVVPPVATTSPLLEELAQLPAQSTVMVRLLSMLDEPKATAADLGPVIELDPALAAQVMRLANSPFYGMVQQVRSVARAVMVLGFTTVRTLTLSAVCSLGGTGRSTPRGFWLHSVTTAAAASVVARRLRLDSSEAFSAGLLHDLGVALLFRHDPVAYSQVLQTTSDNEARVELELRSLGVDHPQVAAAVLRAAQFPPEFVAAVLGHHQPFDRLRQPLSRALVVGHALADLETGEGDRDRARGLLSELGLEPETERLLVEVGAAVESLSGFLLDH